MMKQKILSIITALDLCLGLLPGTAWAAENGHTINKRLDFNNVGTGEGQTPASGEGYEWTGDSTNGYTLTLNDVNFDVNGADVPDPFILQCAEIGNISANYYFGK